jgi:hypothetical protein
MRVKLKRPIQIAAKDGAEIETISELTIREEICAGDLRGIKLKSLEDPSMDDLLKIAGRLAAQPDHVMNRLGLDDMGEIVQAVASFLDRGETSTSTAG